MFPIASADPKVLALCSGAQCFDLYRFVDPLTHEVFAYQGGALKKQENTCCYQMWGRSAPCHNCSSRRAAESRKQMVKLEYLGGDVILIVSLPQEIRGHIYVLELAKDVTDSLIIYDDENHDYRDVLAMIHDFNDLAVRDSFTGLYNKKFINQEISQNIEEAQRKKTPLTAAIIDVDHFKSVNDSYGHLLGDQVIKTIVSYLQKLVCQESAWIGRMGGDEFLVVFPGYTKEQVAPTCRILEEKIGEHVYEKNQKRFHVSVSIGVKEFRAEEDSRESFLDHVDHAMYDAKREK